MPQPCLVAAAVALSLLIHTAPSIGAETDTSRMLDTANRRITNLTTGQLVERLKKDPGLVLVDVRTPAEIDLRGGTIDALENHNVPRGWLEFRIKELVPDKDTPVVVYCGRNLRSPLAAATLMDMGYTQVNNYADGFFDWQRADLPVAVTDEAPDSILYSRPQQVADGVWSAIGATAPPTYANSGHNNNLSFVITDDGVLVVNAGDSYLLARALHDEIRAITDQPVRFVVLENGQGHAMLGAGYWREAGVPIIAHADAAREIEAHGEEILERMQRRSKDKALGTTVVLPDRTFKDTLVLELGGERIELLKLGPAHSPGDIVVWLPERKLVISGDMAFHERLLPVFEHTDTAAWIETWDRFAALEPEIVIPGHGGPTTMGPVTRYTRDYLVYMRQRIGETIDEGGDLQDAYAVDQSPYAHLDTFDELARQNAGRIFRQMEFE